MTAILVVLVGVAIMVGKDDFAMKLAKALVGLVLVLSFAPGVIASLDAGASQHGCPSAGALSDVAGIAVLAVALAGIGLALWKARGLFAKRRDDAARRSSSPRDRVAPPPPLTDRVDDGGDAP